MTSSTTSWVAWLMPTSMPSSRARSSFSSLEALPITNAPGHLRELHRRRADPAPDRVDEHGLAGLQLPAREEHVPRRWRTRPGAPPPPPSRRRPGSGRAGGPGTSSFSAYPPPVREADEPSRQAERLATGAAVRALAAGGHDVRVDPVALLPALHPAPDRLDLTGDLDPERVRELDREAGDAFADVDVEVVQRGRPDPDRNLPGPRDRVVDLLEPQDVQAAELVRTVPLSRHRPPVRRTRPAFDVYV